MSSRAGAGLPGNLGPLLAALVALGFALLGGAALSPAAAAIALGVALPGVPVWLWYRSSARRQFSTRALEAWVRGWVQLLACIGLAAALNLSLLAGLLLWLLSLGLLGWMRKPSHRIAVPIAEVAWVGAIAVGLAAWVALAVTPMSLQSDAPAHAAAVFDAMRSGSWIPPDLLSGAFDARQDPRFGVLHGMYAAIATYSGVHPRDLLQYGAVFFAPFWCLAHWALFRACGMPRFLAALAALLYTLFGAGGRGFGLGASSYPGNVAILLATSGWACWLRAAFAERRRFAWGGLLLVGLSTLIHPFAWWIVLLVTGQAALLILLRERSRRPGFELLRDCLAVFAMGLVCMLPRLLDLASIQGSPHAAFVESIAVSENLYVIDPLWLMRWGGPSVLLGLPLAALLVASRRPTPGVWILLSGAVLPWTVGFNPPLYTELFKVVGYLAVRVGRCFYLPALVLAALWLTQQHIADARRRRAVLASLAVLVGVAGMVVDARDALGRRFSRAGESSERWSSIDVDGRHIADDPALEPVLADPRMSYALRAASGVRTSIYPLAHASPRDQSLPRRLADFRRVFDGSAPADSVSSRLHRSAAATLFLPHDVEALYARPEYGFAASDETFSQFAKRLQLSGVEPLWRGESGDLYSIERILAEPLWQAPGDSVAVAFVDSARVPLARGPGYEIVGLRPMTDTVKAGESFEIAVEYRRAATEAPGDADAWHNVNLRFEGPMPSTPSWSRSFSKLYRKFVIERRGRSSARFGSTWAPFDGCSDPANWAGGLATELRRVSVPSWIAPGHYAVEVTVQEVSWHPMRTLSEYLRDPDRGAIPRVTAIEILP